MKIAQLHNGTEIHFPDETPDEAMDTTVQQHIASLNPQPSAEVAPPIDPMPVLMQAIMPMLTKFIAEKQMTEQQEITQDQEENALRMRELDQNAEAILQTNQIMQTLATRISEDETLPVLAEGVDCLRAMAKCMPDFVEALQGIAAAITEGSVNIVRQMQQPASIGFDPVTNKPATLQRGIAPINRQPM